MTNTVSENEIQRDIEALHRKIIQCGASIINLNEAIQKEEETIRDLNFYIREEKRNVGKRQKYDILSLEHNINRCEQNIKTFNEVIGRENASIDKFKYMIAILREDLKRPTEIIFDASTGQTITR